MLTEPRTAPITSKAQMYDLYFKGAFGNRLRSWETLQALQEDPFQGLIGMRNRQTVNGTFVPHVAKHEVAERVWWMWVNCHIHIDSWMFSAMAPDEHIILQGEVWRSTEGLYLRYSTALLPMRQALAQEELHASGLRAKMLLEGSMDAASYDWLGDLLDLYPDHIVEFSTYKIHLGDLDRRCLVWEVRGTY